MQFDKKAKLKVLLALVLLVLPLVYYYFSTIPLRSGPNWLLYIGSTGFFGMFLDMFFPLFIVATIPLAINAIFRKKRQLFITLIGIVLLFDFIGSIFAIKQINKFKRDKMVQATIRGKPIIAAIENYYKNNNKYPKSLNDLIPQYISSIPNTGMCGYPDFEYSITTSASGYLTKEDYGSDPMQECQTGGYEISIETGLTLQFDRFVYWPKKVYPYYMYGGVIERIADWAYVHE